jgi:arginase
MKIALLGIPLDLGANVQGSREGPDKIREYLMPLLKKNGITYKDFGNVLIAEDDHPETDPKKKNYGEIEHACVNFLGFEEFIDSDFPIVLGGDHSVTICFVRSLSTKGKTGLIYFDGHGDFNTPATTPSGNIHGMVITEITSENHGNVLRLVCKYCVNLTESNVVLIGTRDLDKEEADALEKSNVTVFDMEKVKELGIEKIMELAIAIASRGTQQIHLSFDLDVADPIVTPGVSTPVPGGLLKEQVFKALKTMKGKVTSMDVVEYIPKRDVNGRTGKFAAEIITFFLKEL